MFAIAITNSGEDACRWGLQGAGDNPILFGDTFLRSAYVVYNIDGEEVGIAQTKFNVTETDIKQITAVSNLPGATSTASGSLQQTDGGPIYNTDGGFGGSGGASIERDSLVPRFASICLSTEPVLNPKPSACEPGSR